jgi:hypothetical protein
MPTREVPSPCDDLMHLTPQAAEELNLARRARQNRDPAGRFVTYEMYPSCARAVAAEREPVCATNPNTHTACRQ